MNRKEAYELIKSYELENEIKNKYGKNYTNVPTDALIETIENFRSIPDDEEEDDGYENEQISAYEAACLAFLGILKDSGALEDLLEQL